MNINRFKKINMTEYVCGLMFSENRENVLLIEKNRPEWQAGKLNGVGGKIDLGDKIQSETPDYTQYAMAREFREEVGIETSPYSWERFCILQGTNSIVYMFKTFTDDIHKFQQMESEEPRIIPAEYVWFHNPVPNLPFLVRMALDTNEHFQILCNIKGGANVPES